MAIAAPKIKWNEKFQNYFDTYKALAIREMSIYGIPASITLAQGVLESAAGQSRLATMANNHFGIKCHDWTGRTIYHDDDLNGECFRAYDSVLESYEDHSRFLAGRQRYRSLFELDRLDYKGWAYGLKRAGYATNPNYAYKLIEIIELYKLYEYDREEYNPKQEYQMPLPATKPAVKVEKDIQKVPNGAHQVFMYNNLIFIIAQNGDTFKRIAQKVNINPNKLAAYNERQVDDVIKKGEYIWLTKKAKRGSKDTKKKPHIVYAQESLYDISQRYGIRLKYLIKKNKKIVKRGINIGDKVRLY